MSLLFISAFEEFDELCFDFGLEVETTVRKIDIKHVHCSCTGLTNHGSSVAQW